MADRGDASASPFTFVDPRELWGASEDDRWDVIDTVAMDINGWESAQDEDEDEERLLEEQLQAEMINHEAGKAGRKRKRSGKRSRRYRGFIFAAVA